MGDGGRFSVEAIFTAVNRMSAPIGAMHASVTGFTNGLEKGLGKLDSFNSKVSDGLKATAGAVAAAGAAAGAVAVNSIQAGMAFEQQMANLGAAYLKTRGQIGDLEAMALKLGASTQFSATEVAHAMEEMAKAGFEEVDSLKGIEGMTYAAAAAGEDLVETSATVAAVMKGMGIEIEKSTQVADVLALASVKTASSIGSLGESLSKLGPVAKQMKIPLNETVAMVALLQDAGIDASEAGTATATMLTKLATPTDAVKAKMQQLGISFQNAAGDMKTPQAVLGEFVEAGKKSSGNMKQMAFFAELLGLRGQKAGILLKDAFASGKFDKLVSDLAAAKGTAEKMSNLRMNTLSGDIDVFTENVKGLQVQLFSLNSGPLRGAVQKATKWLDANQAVIIERVQSGIAWTIGHLPEIVTWLERIGKAVAVFYAFSAAVKGVQFAIEAYQAAVIVAKVAQWGFVGALSATRGALETMQALNAAAHMSKTGQAIEGVTSKLGKAGMLGAALGVGYAIGTWANQTFGLDEKISGWIASLTGLDDKLNQMGGRAEKPGLQPGGDQHLADGSIRAADGTWKVKSEARKQKEAAAAGKASQGMIAAATAPSDRSYLIEQPAGGIPPLLTPQMVSPQERTARSIEERSTTEKNELVIKDETGRAELTKKPKTKHSTIRLESSGTF
jgi:TP901 family phage tail tape measure protein